MTTPSPYATGLPAGGAAQLRRGRPARARAGSLVTPVSWDPIRIMLVALMLVTIARVHAQFPVLQVFRPGILLTFGALALALVLPKAVRFKTLTSAWPVRRVFMIFAIALAAAPFGLSVGASVKFVLEHYLPNIVYFALLVVAVRNTGDLRFLMGGYVLSLAILSFLALFVWEVRTFDGFQRMYSPDMYDANDLCAIFAAGMPLCLHFAQTAGKWGRILGWAATIGSPMTIALSGSRGGFLALIVTGVGLLVMMPRVTWGRRIGVVAGAVIAVAAVAPDGYLTKMNTIINADQDYNVTDETGRIAIWKRGLGYLAPRPLTGVGIGNFVRAQWEMPEINEAGEAIRGMSAHNSFLQIGVELGVPVFLLYVSVVIGGSIGLARLRRKLPVSWLTESADRRFLYSTCSYLPVAFAGWATGAFFVSHAYLMPYYILAAYLSAFLILLRREMRGMPAPRRRRRSPREDVPQPQAEAAV